MFMQKYKNKILISKALNIFLAFIKNKPKRLCSIIWGFLFELNAKKVELNSRLDTGLHYS
jgi:hypothetical protein